MSRREPDETIVLFRFWPAEGNIVIALFPEMDEGNGMCGSFMHIGQHASADYQGILKVTRPALPAEYASLRRELESAPYHYNLAVRVRFNRRKLVTA